MDVRMIQAHITECKKRINVISNTGFSKSNVGKKNICILETTIDALEKQIPKYPKKTKADGYRYTDIYRCPNCEDNFAGTGIAGYCYHCGQALDWGKEWDDED